MHDYHQVVNAVGHHPAGIGVDDIVTAIDHVHVTGRDVAKFVLVAYAAEGGPGTDVVPAKVSRHHHDFLASLEHSDIDVVTIAAPPGLQPAIADEALFARVVAAAFSQRRKTLRNALSSLCSETVLRQANIDPGARGETLAVADFVRLANTLQARSLGT